MLTVKSACRIAVVFVVAAALAACDSGGSKSSGPRNTPSATRAPVTTLPAEPPGGYDISRIANLANQLPPGFTVTQIPRTTLTKEQADSAAGLASQFAFTFDPPQCNAVLKPAGVSAGSVSQGFVAQGPQQITAIAAQSPRPVPNDIVGAGCDHVAFRASGSAQGTSDRCPGPAIDGVFTAAIKVHLDFADGDFSKSIDRLTYFAVLSEKTAVVVDGESNPQLLEDLLVKAVKIIRQH